ncbi:Late embryogenesis abundant (LEA) hydroxyproline-rich glycoprotein family [Raphanus sativus]|uniref:NDR1/HIN1-like protein 10 n=1 Tax=Raphanus sativus TaxID=3726 RepID=A0A6J0M4P1_RAPSA|nr:NDR1/HIN1-like protein 10 [Raphanus sativus]KAJ4903099.1 Late embryogenesis abundant (LEA) hydroxyproline-rich glycoprotein family [Raphanus sativus]
MQQDPNSRPAPGYPYPYPPPQPANGYPPNPGTAYPYQNHNPSYYPPPPQPPSPRAVLIRRLFTAFTVLLLILGIILFIFFIVVRPQPPTVYLNSLSVSNFTVADNRLTGKWDLRLQFQNPNSKMSLHYDDVLCTLHRGRETLSETRLQPFDLGTKDQAPFNATLSVSGTYVDGRVVDSIGKERAEKGSVEFDLRVDSLVTFRYGVYRRRRYVTVFCDDVAVGVGGNSTSGNMVGLGMRCKPY